jgi:hypothetical protein
MNRTLIAPVLAGAVLTAAVLLAALLPDGYSYPCPGSYCPYVVVPNARVPLRVSIVLAGVILSVVILVAEHVRARREARRARLSSDA